MTGAATTGSGDLGLRCSKRSVHEVLQRLPRRPIGPTRALAPLFVLAVFTSAALIFVLEPMVAKLLLPRLGGSAAVWNTSLVFFQAALLLGYGYAHWLQRFRSLRAQAAIHLLVLAVALLFLPIRISSLFGDPSPNAPIGWLLVVLTLSIGFPFAALSATTPLLQRWYTALRLQSDGTHTYWFYGASNLGSLVALVAYPTTIEPHVSLTAQRLLWSQGLVVFFGLVLALVFFSRRIVEGRVSARGSASNEKLGGGDVAAVSPDHVLESATLWRERIVWILLAAAPASLMLGVTTYLVTDVASAPFLWVIPLALYLLTFVIAFARRPPLSLRVTLVLQAALVALCLGVLPFEDEGYTLVTMFGLNLATFFFSALACHQTLVARRPPPERATEFFLSIAFGGVVGGSFNALVAPLIFKTVVEYPLVLILVALARPWGRGWLRAAESIALAFAVGLAVAAALHPDPERLARILLAAAALAAFFARARAWGFMAALAAIFIAASYSTNRERYLAGDRGFFGVLRMAQDVDETEGHVSILYSGTTMHGAEIAESGRRCRPMLYYAPTTPIGQAVRFAQRRSPALDIGVVGLGTGTLAAYTRRHDGLTYFEINPKVLGFALDRSRFAYIRECAKGKVRIVMGDARLMLGREAPGRFDLLVVDAFTSDSVPTHLLTEEALRGYLRVLKPDGVVVLHLSNRNLELMSPAAAGAAAIGAPAFEQYHPEAGDAPYLADAATEAVAFARSKDALRDYAHDRRWTRAETGGTAPWTDDYSDVFGALWRNFRDSFSERARSARLP